MKESTERAPPLDLGCEYINRGHPHTLTMLLAARKFDIE